MLIYIFGIIIALLLVSLYLTRNYAKKRDASAKLAWGIIGMANEKVTNFQKELQMSENNKGTNTGSNTGNCTSGGGTCAGLSCPCKKGGPCASIPEHKTETLSNGDVVHMCPKCGEKMYTLKNGEPLNFLEHQCGCGHWGWLHL